MGDKLRTKIWESLIDKGIGGLLAPWQIKREGKSRTEVSRHELLVLAQAELDIADISSGKKTLDEKGRLISRRPVLPAPAEKAEPAVNPEELTTELVIREGQVQASAREAQRTINLQRIAIKAEEEAEDVPDEEVSGDHVDPDWFEHWRENAQKVSNEDLQRLGARVLAGETKQPGSFSLHTLVSENNYLREESPSH